MSPTIPSPQSSRNHVNQSWKDGEYIKARRDEDIKRNKKQNETKQSPLSQHDLHAHMNSQRLGSTGLHQVLYAHIRAYSSVFWWDF